MTYIAAAIFGACLAIAGLHVNQWQFWLVFLTGTFWALANRLAKS